MKCNTLFAQFILGFLTLAFVATPVFTLLAQSAPSDGTGSLGTSDSATTGLSSPAHVATSSASTRAEMIQTQPMTLSPEAPTSEDVVRPQPVSQKPATLASSSAVSAPVLTQTKPPKPQNAPPASPETPGTPGMSVWTLIMIGSAAIAAGTYAARRMRSGKRS